VLVSLAGYSQTNYYVSTTGDDEDDGSIGNPWATFQYAVDNVSAGDTVNFRGGTYYTTNYTTINPEDSHGATGTSSGIITYRSYPGEWAIFNCEQHSAIQYNKFLEILYAEYIHLKDFEIKNVYGSGTGVDAAINTSWSRNLEFHNLKIHDISTGRGFYIGGGAWQSHYEDGDTGTEPFWSGYLDSTKIINCDIYNLCDTLTGGGNADGGFITHYRGNEVTIRGTRVWNYSDDGFDLHTTNGAIYNVDSCWIWPNNYSSSVGDMEWNGFKISPNLYDIDTINTLVATNNIVVGGEIGFYELGTYFGTYGKYFNNFMYLNGIHFANMGDAGTVLRNNVTHKAATYGSGNVRREVNIAGDATETNNTWDYDADYPYYTYTDTVTVVDTSFLSLDPNELITARKTGGWLPDINFGKLRHSSDLIGMGIQPKTEDNMTWSIDSAGVQADAPDIGAWEYTGITDVTDTDILDFIVHDSLDVNGLDGSGQYGYETINTGAHTVTAVVYYKNDLSSLAPTILVADGATVSPLSGSAQDFSGGAVTYTVTSANATEQEWDITITRATASTAVEVASFAIAGTYGGIDDNNDELAIYYIPATDISDLTPSIQTSRGSTISPLSGVSQDYTNPVTYTVTAEDGVTEKEWEAIASELEAVDSGDTLGYIINFIERQTSNWYRGQPYVVGETGYLKSVSIYHSGGTGDVLLGVYNTILQDHGLGVFDPIPGTLLGQTDATAINVAEGWQTINLQDSVAVTATDTVWLAYVFEDNPGVGNLEYYEDAFRTVYNVHEYPVTDEMRSPYTGDYDSQPTSYITSIYANYTEYATSESIRRVPHTSSGGNILLNSSGKPLYIREE